MSTSKKIFIASFVFFLITFLFWGIYNLSFKEKTDDSSKNNSKEVSEKPTESLEKINQVTQDSVISPIILPDGVTIRYYEKNTGHVFQIDLSGNNKKNLSLANLPDLEKIYWSSSKNRVLAKSKESTSYFDFEKTQGGRLNSGIKSINFQNENKIIYTYQNTNGSSSLNVADFDGKNWKKLTDLDFFGQKLKPVPQTGLISFWNYADSNYESKFYTVPLIGGDRKLIFEGKFGGSYLWNHNGSHFLVSSTNEKGGEKISLGIFNFQENTYEDLGIPTFAEKCAWSKDNKTIFYALPGSIPQGSILPNDYLNNKFFTADTFWKVNIETGEKERLLELEEITEKLDATELFLNNDESILFFINRYDGKIYSLKL